MSGVLIFNKPMQQGAKIHFVWAVKQSVEGLWHQIGRPCLFLVSGASQPSGKKWAVMIHHKLCVRYNTERYGCSPPLCISPLLLQHEVLWLSPSLFLLFEWELKTKMKTQNLALVQLVARFPSQLLPAENNVDFPNNLSSVEEYCAWIFRGAHGCCNKTVRLNSICAGLFKHSQDIQLFIAAWLWHQAKWNLFSASYLCNLPPSVCVFNNNSVSLLHRFYPHLWRQFKRAEWDDRKPRVSIWISKWSELYLGDCCRGGKQDSYSFSIFRCGGGIWLFILVWRASTPRQLQDKVRKQLLTQQNWRLYFKRGIQGWK